MALIKCTECGKEVSDKAAACPNCGCPVPRDEMNDQTKEELQGESEDVSECASEKTANDVKEIRKATRKTKSLVVALVSVSVLLVVAIIFAIAIMKSRISVEIENAIADDINNSISSSKSSTSPAPEKQLHGTGNANMNFDAVNVLEFGVDGCEISGKYFNAHISIKNTSEMMITTVCYTAIFLDKAGDILHSDTRTFDTALPPNTKAKDDSFATEDSSFSLDEIDAIQIASYSIETAEPISDNYNYFDIDLISGVVDYGHSENYFIEIYGTSKLANKPETPVFGVSNSAAKPSLAPTATPNRALEPKKQATPTPKSGSTDTGTQGGISSATKGERNALSSAKTYLSVMPFSHSGLVKQLEYEGYSHSEAVYGADNCGADWNAQAAKSAEAYLDMMAFSRDGLIDQLEYEGYTHAQAVYGASANGY